MTDLPAIEPAYFDDALASKLTGNNETMPRILILYGSVRERSYSRFAAEEAGRLLAKMGAEVKIFNPSDHLHDNAQADDGTDGRRYQAAELPFVLSDAGR